MKNYILFILLMPLCFNMKGQSLGLNNATPHASSIIDMVATDRGVLIPRIALTATNAVGPVAAPADALLVYNTATAGVFPNNVTPGYYYYNTLSTSWLRLFSSGTTGIRWDQLKDPLANLALTHGAFTTDFNFNTFTTGTAFGLSSSSLTTGTLFSSTTSNAAATGNALLVTSNSTGASVNGIARFNFTGAHTNNGLQVDDITATGTAFALAANSLTSGTGFSNTSTATAFTGQLGLFSLTGNNAANTGTIFKASTTGVTNVTTVAMISNAGTGLGLRLNDDGTDTDGTPIVVDAAGNMGVGIAAPLARLHVYETTGTTLTGSAGTLILEHGDAGGQSGIVFKSKVNCCSDYGYLKYSDDGSGNGSTTSNGLLELGVQNDGVGASQDDIAIMPTGYLGIGTNTALAHFDIRKTSLRFGTGSSTFTNLPTAQTDVTDAMGLYAVSLGGSDTDFRFYVDKDATDRISFWGGSCGGGSCNSLSNSSSIMTLMGGGSVGIGQTSPDASSKLDIVSTNKGILIPRLALTATNAIAPVTAPADALLVYNTATAGGVGVNVTPGFYYYNTASTTWIRFNDGLVWDRWDQIKNPTANLSLTHGTYATTMGFSNTTTDAFSFTNNSLTSGNGLVVNSSSAGITSGSLLKLSSTGIIGNASGSLLNVTSSAANTNGYLATITCNSVAAGGLFNVSTSSAASTGTLAHFASTGASTGTVAMISNAGTGFGLRLNDDGTDTDATPLVVTATGNMGLGLTAPAGKLHIYETTGTTLTATAGTMILEHNDNGGQSSILFKSTADVGSDYGYMKYSDDGSGNGSTAENSLLEIGVQNDGIGTTQDDIAMMPTGYVGIGTIAPKGKLHLYETTGITASASAGTLMLEHGNSGGQSSIVFKSTVNPGVDYGYIKYSDDGSGNGSTTDNSLLEIGVQTGAAGATTQDDIAFMPSGNMGIGTVTPKGMLHVYEATGTTTSASAGTIILEHGDAGGQSSIVFKSTVNANSDYGYMKYSDDGSGNGSTAENGLLEIGVQNDGVGANQDDIAFMPTGYMGVGTTSPGEFVHVSSTGNNLLMLQSTTGGANNTSNLDFQTYATIASTLRPTARISAIDDGSFSSQLAFLTKTTGADANALVERMRVTASGNLGVGTTVPVANAKLAIKDGHFQVQQTTAPTIAIGAGATAASVTNGTDMAGNISITSNTTLGVAATVTFNMAYTTAPIVIITPAGASGANAAAEMVSAKIYVTSSTTNFVINFGAAPTANTKTFTYQVIETQ